VPVNIRSRIISTLALVKIHNYKKNQYIFFLYSWSWYQWINWQKYFFSKTCKIFISTLSTFLFILFFYLFYFYIYIFYFLGLGWAGPRRLLPASVRELPTHAGYSYYVIIFLMHTVGELSCKTGDTYLGARWRRWRAVPLFVFFKLLPLVLDVGAGEEEADCDAGAFFCGFLVSLSSSLRPFTCFAVLFPVFLSLSLSICPGLPLRLSVRGEGGATRVATSTALEEDDDEGAVAGQNLLSPLYNLCLFSCPLFLFRLLLSLSLCFCIVFMFLVPCCSWLFVFSLSAPRFCPFSSSSSLSSLLRSRWRQWW